MKQRRKNQNSMGLILTVVIIAIVIMIIKYPPKTSQKPFCDSREVEDKWINGYYDYEDFVQNPEKYCICDGSKVRFVSPITGPGCIEPHTDSNIVCTTALDCPKGETCIKNKMVQDIKINACGRILLGCWQYFDEEGIERDICLD